MSEKLKDTFSWMVGEIKDIASTETVVGDPITLGDKMVVPISRVMVGFGVGGGEGQDDKKAGGAAGGGAGGVRVDPVGFIVIQGDAISFLPTKTGKLEGLIDAIPDIVDKIQSKGSDSE